MELLPVPLVELLVLGIPELVRQLLLPELPLPEVPLLEPVSELELLLRLELVLFLLFLSMDAHLI